MIFKSSYKGKVIRFDNSVQLKPYSVGDKRGGEFAGNYLEFDNERQAKDYIDGKQDQELNYKAPISVLHHEWGWDDFEELQVLGVVEGNFDAKQVYIHDAGREIDYRVNLDYCYYNMAAKPILEKMCALNAKIDALKAEVEIEEKELKSERFVLPDPAVYNKGL